MTEDDFPDALPSGHRLHWYVLERVLGQGGFGITYLARDTNLDRLVAIKEYLPADVARRRSDASARPRTESHTERFAWGLERFLAEARTLARFDHPNIVRVLSIFEANNTAYMVMRYEEGEDLGTLLDRVGTLAQRELLDCLMPVLAGLQLIHSAGFIHRDVKPENIYMRDDGTPVLLDFGSARQSFGTARTMTILVAPGYAPLEQYYGDAKTQGPWTDIYGLAATCYRAVTGHAPLDAVARAKGVLGSTRDLLEPTAALAKGEYDPQLLTAIDHALQLSERDRPQSIAEWRREITGPRLASTTPGVSMVAGVPAASDTKGSTLEAAVLPEHAEPVALEVAPASKAGHGLWSGAQRWSVFIGCVVLISTAVLVLAHREPARSPALELAAAGSSILPESPVSAPRPPSFGAAPADTTHSDKLAEPPAVETTMDRRDDSKPSIGRESPAPDRPEHVDRPRASVHSEPTKASARAERSSTTPASSATRAMPVRTFPAGTSPVAAMAAGERGPSAATAAPIASAPVPVAASAAPTAPIAVAAAPPVANTRRRDEQLEAAESALRRGDPAGAAQIAAPLAAAGVARAQTLLGRAQEARAKDQHNDFEAYVWYSIAARRGEPSAQALKDKLAGRLQPAEIRQAEQIIDHWKPRSEAGVEPLAERSSP